MTIAWLLIVAVPQAEPSWDVHGQRTNERATAAAAAAAHTTSRMVSRRHPAASGTESAADLLKAHREFVAKREACVSRAPQHFRAKDAKAAQCQPYCTKVRPRQHGA